MEAGRFEGAEDAQHRPRVFRLEDRVPRQPAQAIRGRAEAEGTGNDFQRREFAEEFAPAIH